MKDKLILKALVCSAFMCSLSMGTMAADAVSYTHLDPLSNMRRVYDERVITSYDALLSQEVYRDTLRPDCMLQIGQMVVSKRVQQWVASMQHIPIISVSPTMDYTNPCLLYTSIVERSKGWGIPLIAIERSQFDSKQAFEQAQLDALEPYCVDGIVLAGYMRIVGTGLIARYEHKILNIHPALLPSFPGLHGCLLYTSIINSILMNKTLHCI